METNEKSTKTGNLEENRPVFFGPCAPLAGAGPKGSASTKDPCRTKTGLPKGAPPLNFDKNTFLVGIRILGKPFQPLNCLHSLQKSIGFSVQSNGKSCRIGAAAGHGRPCCRGQLEATLTAGAAAAVGFPGFFQSTDLDQIQPLCCTS